MDTTINRSLKTALIFNLVLGSILVFFGISLPLGLFLGSLVSFIKLFLTNRMTNKLMTSQHFSVGSFALYFLINLLWIAIPMYCAIMYTQLFSIFTIAIGLFSIKISIYLNELIKGLGGFL